MASGVVDRRRTEAYPIEVNVDYQILDSAEPWASGRGKTVNISGKRITFTPEHPIPTGRCIKLGVDWPARLDQGIALKLHITGMTTELDRGAAVVNISRHEFRVANRNQSALPCTAVG
jgi:hypothetical protein